MEVCRTRTLRKEMTSYAMSTAHAASKAMQLVSTMIKVILLLIESEFRNFTVGFLRRCGSGFALLDGQYELGPELQPAAGQDLTADVPDNVERVNAGAFADNTHVPSLLDKAFHVGNRQQPPVLQRLEGFAQAALFRRGNEQDVAVGNFLDFREQPDFHLPFLNQGGLHHFDVFLREWILAENSDDERGVAAGKVIFPPRGKLREDQNILRLGFVFGLGRGFTRQHNGETKHRRRSEERSGNLEA